MRFPLSYPLTVSFKIVALAPQMSVTDSTGLQVAYIKQKLLKLKEDVNVYDEVQQTSLAFNLRADRVIDFSPRFQFIDHLGGTIGSVKRQGAKSLWRARYDIYNGEIGTAHIEEENPWTKVWDGLVGEIPVVGLLSGYLFHPSYRVVSAGDLLLMRMEKLPAFFEGKFRIEKMAPLSADEEARVFLSLLTMLLMERARG